jgi:CheY-like chemotaxis protein
MAPPHDDQCRAGPTTPPQPPLVLVADDEPAMRIRLQRLLERAGFRVETVADGAAALTRWQLGGVDLLLIDLMMLRVDGLELCRRVREREQEPYVPIIILTRSVNAADRRAGFALGVDDYLLKPFHNQAVIDRLRAWTRAAHHALAPSGGSLSPRASAAEPAPPRGERPLEYKPPVVLIVDDDPAVRGMLSELLSAAGYGVKAAARGKRHCRGCVSVAPQRTSPRWSCSI